MLEGDRVMYAPAVQVTPQGSSDDAEASRVLDALEHGDDQHRLAPDVLVFEALATANFAGPRYDAFAADLWAYAMPVIKSMIRTGRIQDLGQRRGVPIWINSGERQALHASLEDRDELAVDTIAWTIEFFRTSVLSKGKWDPAKGTSLRTYFIGACAFGFHRAFRIWSVARGKRIYEFELDLWLGRRLEPLEPDVAEQAARRDLLGKILARATPEARAICGLILQDLTYAEIGERLHGLTARAVEGHMHRLRKQAKKITDSSPPRIKAAALSAGLR